MLIKGEKYACEACVRGHRVTNCQHSDRPLQHINKKGRPVSQCVHCRTLRKSRSAHVRCDCGEKAHAKGVCLQDGETQVQDPCACSHGSRCSCALKKEHLDPVPESDSDEALPMTAAASLARRPRAHTAQSEPSLTVFTNGHHKPSHKHNTMAHKCGMPYVVPRSNSIHGATPAGLANRSVDNLPHTSTIDALHSESQIKDSMVSAQQEQRMVKSEHGSPLQMTPSNFDLLAELAPLDLDSLPADYSLLEGLDTFLPLDQEPAMYSAAPSSASIDWSHYDGLDFNNDSFAPSYSQPPSFTGYDFSSIDQPALTTTSTSGEISEVEDFGPMAESAPPSLLAAQYGSDLDNSEFGGDRDPFMVSGTPSYMGFNQGMLAGSNGNSTSTASPPMDAFFKTLTSTNGYMTINTNAGHTSSPYSGEGLSKSSSASPYTDETTALANYLPLPAEDEGAASFWEELGLNGVSNVGATNANTVPLAMGSSRSMVENVWSQ